jgi:hypothetical protein
MATAYLGRMQAYVDALDKDDDDALADALARNLYRNKGVDARQNGLVALVKAEAQRLDQLSDPALLKGDLGPIFQL